jgi:hypothetical protein
MNLLAVAAFSLLPILFPPPPPPPEPSTVIAVFGDSLAKAAWDEFYGIAPNHANHYFAEPGAWIPTWENTISYYANSAPRAVVLALGTNDATFSDQAWTASRWDYVLDQLETQSVCVVSLDFRRTRPVDFTFSTAMDPVWTEHVEVHRFDWESYANANPGIHGPDGIHHTPEGEAAYAQAIWDAAQLCEEAAPP